MENPCESSFSRGAASVLVCSVAAIAFVVAVSEEAAVFMSIFPCTIPWHGSAKRAAWPRAGDRSPPRAGAVQFWVRIFGRNRKATRPLLQADGVTVFRNDANMLVICPTGQVAFPAAGRRRPVTLHGVVFDILAARTFGSLHNLPLLFAAPWRKIVCHIMMARCRPNLAEIPYDLSSKLARRS
jgi:hypothetical protein